ncbi:MAG TPA: amino acid adenylation domain-containing protein, partial [Pyrinomonadaceae bacterium]|nr:amino acid adenylation domain-containing protein [Pyrinomonadaceae bacterium]
MKFADISLDRRKLLAMRLQEKGIKVSSGQAIPRRGGEGPWPLSYAQQRLWFLDQLDADSSTYNIPVAARLGGPLDVCALERGLNEIVRRHESLRTTFQSVDGLPVQVILPSLTLKLPVTELRGFGEAEKRAEVRRRADEEARRPFDLTRGPLLRASLLRLCEQEHVILLTMHHIVSDGWSTGLLIRELGALYAAYARGEESPLAELPIQYADYAVWQRERLRGEALEAQLSYWRRRLAGATDVLELPTDRPRPAAQSFRGAAHNFALPADLYGSLKSLCKQEDCTLFMLLLAAFGTFLHRYTGQEDICVGTVDANRDRPEVEPLIGFFVNTLVARADLSGGPTFRELLARTRGHMLEAHAHREAPFEKLVDELRPERSLGHAPLFQVMLVLQNAPRAEPRLPGVTLSLLEVERATAKFDLTLMAEEGEAGLSASFEYSTDLFDASTIERMSAHFRTLLRGIAADPDVRLHDLPLLDEGERRRLLFDYNDTAREDPRGLCAHQLFEEQVRRAPDAVALDCGGEPTTYGELNGRANQLAHRLRRLGVGPDSRVAILLWRSPEMVGALLAVLKAGGCYVPLDPQYPRERLRFMLADSGSSLLLTDSALAAAAAQSWGGEALCLDLLADELAAEADADPGLAPAADNLCYVIYASGSTGRPKGVAVTHAGLSNYLGWAGRAYPAAGGAPVHSPLGFDLTVTSLLLPLTAGGRVALLPEGPGVEHLAAALSGPDGFGLVKLTPAHLDALAGAFAPGAAAGAAAPTLVVGGEALAGGALRWWGERAPAARVVNEYGPTEAVVGCCFHEVLAGQAGGGPVPIGRPVANTRCYVLGRRGELAPEGVAGELYVGGAQVARGYWNRPALTAERFVPDPFGTEPGARLYRTGDVVRHAAGGVLEYVGRLDHQVKLRGHRVELGEVEAALSQHPRVRECAAAVTGEGAHKRLVAYVVASGAGGAGELGAARNEGEAGGGGPDAAELRGFLSERLPEHMVPSLFVALDALPLTPNGKLDRKALPAPDASREASGRGYVAPRTPAEEVLCGVWQEVLGVGRVGVYDNFFELGGDSILSIQVVSRAARRGLRLSPRHLFLHQTVAALAAAAPHAPPSSPSPAGA